MKSVLILMCHPALEKSRLNLAWSRAARATVGVTFVDLYESYPEFDIDARAEQRRLEQSDVIVLQHPLYWYSSPALLKQWFDIVLEHGWAYGAGGDALSRKYLLQAVTTGAPEGAYRPEGHHGIALLELLAPVRQTARLCKMSYLSPFIQYGAFSMTPSDVERSAESYATRLNELVSGRGLSPLSIGNGSDSVESRRLDDAR